MPIFEYSCINCDTQFEKIVFRDAEAVECPACRSSKTKKLLSTFAVANSSQETFSSEGGPCGACGAPRRGMCQD